LHSSKIGNHFYKVVLYQLKSGNSLTELLPFSRIFQGTLICSSCTTHCLPSHCGSCHFQNTSGILKRFASLQAICLRYFTIGERNKRIFHCPKRHFVLHFFCLESRCIFSHHETFNRIIFIARPNYHHICKGGIPNPFFLTV